MNKHQIKNKDKRKAFTLVELLIVITILTILSTIAFISFQNFIKDSRDANRVSSIKNIENWLSLYNLKTSKYPSPQWDIYEWKIDGKTYIIKWEIWDTISKQINLNKLPIDPKTNNNYIYSVDVNNKQYQIWSILEWDIVYNKLINTTYANSLRAKVNWNYKWFLKYNSWSECNAYTNIPSLLWNNKENIDLLLTWSYIVDKWNNLPYSIDKNLWSINSNDIIKYIRNNKNAKLISICEDKLIELSKKINIEPEDQEIIDSFWVEDKTWIKEIILWDKTPTIISYAKCWNIPHLAKKTFYKESSVTYGQICSPWVEFICNNGVLNSQNWENWSDYQVEVPCIVWNPSLCEIWASKDWYTLTWSIKHWSWITLSKTDNTFLNWEKILYKDFNCNNWDLENSIVDESSLITKCNLDYYKNNDSCESVWIWYFSANNDITRTSCTNKPINSIYTSSWNWSNNCLFSCNSWYEWVSCIPKTKNITSWSYNGRTFTFTSFLLTYSTPETKTSNDLIITWWKSKLTSTFTLWNDWISVNISSQSENITCDSWYFKNWSNCETQWSWNSTTWFTFKDTNWNYLYPTSCNNLLTTSTWKNTLFDTPWNSTKFVDWVYFIKPDSWAAFKVYCDMTNNGWWWTLVLNTWRNWGQAFDFYQWTNIITYAISPINQSGGLSWAIWLNKFTNNFNFTIAKFIVIAWDNINQTANFYKTITKNNTEAWFIHSWVEIQSSKICIDYALTQQCTTKPFDHDYYSNWLNQGTFVFWGIDLSKYWYTTRGPFHWHNWISSLCSVTWDINSNAWNDSYADWHWWNGLLIYFK